MRFNLLLTALMGSALLLPMAASAQMQPQAGSKVQTQIPLPAEMPRYAPDRPLPVLDIVRTKLSNGMEVWVLPRNGVPRVDATLVFRDAGFSVDSTPGFAGFFASALKFGTASQDALSIAQAEQTMGGNITTFATHDGIGVSGAAMTSKVAEMFALLSQIMRTPSFPAQEIELNKAITLEGLKAADSMSGYASGYQFLRVILGNHPYANSQPTAASTNAITRDALVAAHAQRIRPERALLVVTGRITAEEAQRLAQAAFGDWKAQGKPAAPPPAVGAELTPRKVLLARPGSVQSNLIVGSPAPAANAEDAIAIKVTGDLLGGASTSRLFSKLREEKGYTYGASTTTEGLRLGGYQFSNAAVRNEVTGAALGDLLGELRRIGTEPVPEDELDAVKRNMVGMYILSNQLQAGVSNTLASNWLMGLPPEQTSQYVSLVRAVTPAKVRQMAMRWFDPDKQSIVAEGDVKAIGAQLKPFGTFEILKADAQ